MKNKISIRTLLLLFGALVLCSTIYAQDYRGKVVGIADGDTFTLLTNNKKHMKVRLSGLILRSGHNLLVPVHSSLYLI